MKTCSKCKKEKSLDEYPNMSKNSTEKRGQCHPCIKEQRKEHYEKNKERLQKIALDYARENKAEVKIKRIKWKQENPLKQKEIYKKNYWKNRESRLENNKEWCRKNRDLINKRRRERRKNDPLYKSIDLTRCRIKQLMKRRSWFKSRSTTKLLGATPETIKQYIEKQFKNGMTWDNHRILWELDHKIPLSLAKNQTQLEDLCFYTNLQPLLIEDNKTKSNKRSDYCWQKLRRDITEELDRDFPRDLSPKDFALSKEDMAPEHRNFIAKYEWLGKVGYGVRWVFTARWQGKLAGVVMVSEPTSYQFGEKEALIQRGACSSWAPKNLNSMLVMFSCRWLAKNTNKRIFTAYSDAEAGEIGTIYQACNFDYLGQEYGSKFYYVLENGSKVSSRYFTRTSSMKKWAKELGMEWQKTWEKDNGYQIYALLPQELKDYALIQMKKYQKLKAFPKHKYVLLINYGKEKVKKSWEQKPYPKRKIC